MSKTGGKIVCTFEEYEEFLRTVPEFERMLVCSGIILIKYWFLITDEEQYFRLRMRIHDHSSMEA